MPTLDFSIVPSQGRTSQAKLLGSAAETAERGWRTRYNRRAWRLHEKPAEADGPGVPECNDVRHISQRMAFGRCVPSRVWSNMLGGYQVMKKWLSSYRERNLLGRALTLAELTEVMHVARRIAALLLLQPALDANYQAVKAASYVWPLGERG